MRNILVCLLLLSLPGLFECQGTQTTPQQVHLSFTNISSVTGDNAVGVSWVTRATTQFSVVRYGTNSGTYTKEVAGFVHTYTQGNWRGYIHDVVLNGLSSSTQYFYIAGDFVDGWSKEFSFVTKPAISASINVLVLGDIATSSNTKTVLASTLKQPYTLALIAGDLSYADGDNTTWDNYFSLIEHQAANTIWMPAIGNHEASSTDYSGVPYLQRHILPGNELWYAFNYGPIHVLVFSTEHATGPTSEQYKFIDQDLKSASANRANRPFIIAVAHKPIYTSNLAHSADLVVRANIEPLLIRYGVDIAIWGHNHCYERSYPMQNSTPNNTRTGSASQPYNTLQAPIHVTIGTGGKTLYSSWSAKPSYCYYREAVYGFAKFSVENQVLHWQFVRTDGSVPDEFYIIKK